MMSIYRVYVTLYRGAELPPFYIGSTSEARLHGGYRGSVRSKKYRKIWERELALHPERFRTLPLSTRYSDRAHALAAEHRLQVMLNVVRSPLYVNQSIASKSGCFGRDVGGELHPLYGKGHSEKSRAKISANHADFSGIKNGRAMSYRFRAPTGEETIVTGGFKQFCKENGLPLGSALFLISGRVFSRGACIGWSCQRL
jgi:hypothetical protein